MQRPAPQADSSRVEARSNLSVEQEGPGGLRAVARSARPRFLGAYLYYRALKQLHRKILSTGYLSRCKAGGAQGPSGHSIRAVPFPRGLSRYPYSLRGRRFTPLPSDAATAGGSWPACGWSADVLGAPHDRSLDNKLDKALFSEKGLGERV